jgi:predicted  nucleic acid-binding Zn-ribbon protein
MEVDNTEKKYTVKSIPPKDEMMAQSIFETNYELFEPLYFKECDDTFTTCTFVDGMASKAYTNVKITYDYDESIAVVAQKAVDEGLIDNNKFEATDVELLNYLLYGGSLANYTSSFKNQLSNYNFVSEIDQRGGAAGPFNTAAIGFYRATYNGTIYAIKDFIEINAPHIIYIPDDATNKVEAVKNRLKDIFGDDASKLKVTESTDTINELLTAFGEDTVGAQGDETYLIIENNNEDCYYYGMQMFFAVVKDSSKVNNTVSFKSSDLLTNVTVETDSDIPLDTIVGVNHITSGDSYNNIISVLAVEDGEVFEINLNSIAQKRNITKLENGKFLVKIPVPSKYEGKALIVYYVDEDNNITPYEVTVSDGYATFETDHFSTYTLTTTVANPATGDNVLNYIIMFIISTIGLIGLPIYAKNRSRQ